VLDGTGTGVGTGGAAGFFSNAITNFETLTKQGTGNWSLSAPTPPTFTGVTVSQGTLGIGGFNSTDVTIAPGAQLVFDGPVHTTGTVTVNGTLASEGGDPIHIDGGTLKGASTIEAPVVLGGDAIVAPGNSPGTLTINGDFTMGPNNHLQIEIADLTHFDLLKVLGVATLDGKLDVLVDSAFAPPGGIATGQTFDVVSANSIVDGLDVLTDNLPGFTFTKQVLDLGGGDQVLRLTVNAVPLPGTLPLIGSALAVFGLLKRKKAA
jgi:autotransporter-associated beta strand protein